MAKIEALYETLQVIQEADVDESIWQAALDEYVNQVDLIDSRDLHGFSNPCRFAGTGPMGTGMGQQIDTRNPSPTRH